MTEVVEHTRRGQGGEASTRPLAALTRPRPRKKGTTAHSGYSYVHGAASPVRPTTRHDIAGSLTYFSESDLFASSNFRSSGSMPTAVCLNLSISALICTPKPKSPGQATDDDAERVCRDDRTSNHQLSPRDLLDLPTLLIRHQDGFGVSMSSWDVLPHIQL